MQSLIPIVFVVLVVGLGIWLKTRRGKKPIKGKGYGILVPLAVMLVGVPWGLYQLMHIPGKTFHMPAVWELLIAILLGVIFGVVMLTQTEYERREDGLIYPKPNRNLKYILIAIVAIRLLLTQYFKSIDVVEFSVLMMCMGALYVGIWRIGSYIKFTKIVSSHVTQRI
ncbi:CcdC protein domain-containing protein [Brevibacillus nitrificans]|uniref:CcdC protein domain-containing protein n=1 Tax=Brevibacillus nitrificans TaxID=651560 RepID=UPI00261B421C|nr:CcdC protein domain-containing protein [Brevibacillus nitrificans]